MNAKQTIQGLAAVAAVGGIARICMAPAAYIWGANSMAELVFGFSACVLMGIGIIGLYLYQTPNVGPLGFAATLLIATSNTLTAALVWNNMLGVGPEDHRFISTLLPINTLLMLTGQLIFSVSAIRARAYPLWCLILFVVYPAIYFLPVVSDLGSVAWGLCYIAFGLRVLQDRQEAPSYSRNMSI